MNAARALREARRLAGMSQAELARRAGVPRQLVNQIERAARVPRVDTLTRILAAAGATMDIRPRLGAEVDRGPIQALLRKSPRDRLSRRQIEALDWLCRRKVRFIVVGDAAAQLHGAPVTVLRVEIVLDPDPLNLRRLLLAVQKPVVKTEIVHCGGGYRSLRRDASELPWLPAPTRRVLNEWLDAPTGYLASIGDLVRSAGPERRTLLAAVQEETDRLRLPRARHGPLR